MTKVRLQVALAKAGVASRREAEKFIESNRVEVNGEVVNERGFRVDIEKDRIHLDGKSVIFEKKRYYILNKPSGILSTAKDERGRKTVLYYAKDKGARLYPVGRLDKDTTGLILLTNDGDLTYRMTHPKFEVERVYEVKVRGAIGTKEIYRLERGVVIDGKEARAQRIVLKKKSTESSTLRLTLREGRKREVRRMFGAIGHVVIELKRVAFGPLKLGSLQEGEIRPLTRAELSKLKECVGVGF